MNGAPGMRTPGSLGDVAQPSRICQWTRNGVVKTSRRKPSPGTIAVNACGWGTMSRNSTSSTSPGWAPLTKTGPVRGWIAPASMFAMSASVVPGPSWPSTPSRVARTTSSPSSTVTQRRDVRVEPVVARRRLISQALAAVDLDALHRRLLYTLRRSAALDHQNGAIMTDQSLPRLRHPGTRPARLRRLPGRARPRPRAHDRAALHRHRGRDDRQARATPTRSSSRRRRSPAA